MKSTEVNTNTWQHCVSVLSVHPETTLRWKTEEGGVVNTWKHILHYFSNHFMVLWKHDKTYQCVY